MNWIRPKQTSRIQAAVWWSLTILAFWLGFWIAIYHLQRESLWYDEGWTMWSVRDSGPVPETPLQAVQYVKNSLTETLARIRSDVHPPLYFLLLDVWVLLVGESVFAVRLLSALLGMLALAATYALGARWFDRRTALMALILLGTTSFFVYYTREARMYTLLVALSALSTWAYSTCLAAVHDLVPAEAPIQTRQVRLRRRWRVSAIVYALLLALLLYTHYAGALVIAAQGIHLVFSLLVGRQRLGVREIVRGLAPYLLALLLYAPWIPVVLTQIRVSGGRPLAEALPPDWATIAPLILIVTSGFWWMYVLPLALGLVGSLMRSRVMTASEKSGGSQVLFLCLWLVITPLTLLALNMWVTPIFQIRYNIAILPAGALLIAYGLRQIRHLPLGWGAGVLQVFLLGWLAYTQLAMYSEFWPDKSRWREAVVQMTAARQPLEPALTDINNSSVVAYYDRQYQIRRGISLDVSWRDHTPEEMQILVGKLDSAPSVWTVMRSDVPSTWDAIAALSGERGVGYRDSVMNFIFYRFDALSDDKLHFRFGDAVQYEGGIGHQLYARSGQQFCPPLDLHLTALIPLEGSYGVGLALTQGYNTLRVRWDGELGQREAGDPIPLAPCLDVPADTPRGPHHLRLVLYQNADSHRLPVIEGENLYWGTELILAVVSVENK